MSFTQQFQKYSIPLLTNGVKLPKFQLSPEDKERYKNDNCYKDDYEFLRALCIDGFVKKVGKFNPKYKEYQQRMDKELSLFKELEFCGYVLITWDIINFCRRNNIGTGYARGSAAGSLVLYLIDVVSHVDPVKNNLYFERFLSKARAKFKEIDGVKHYDGSLLLDIDIDISFRQRSQVIEYLDNKYKSQTAKLLTVSTLTSKILIKEVIKVYLGSNEDDANIVSDMIPKVFGKVYNIEDSIKESPEFAGFADKNKEAILIAKKLHGLYLHYGVHPSAVVISAEKINDILPLQCTKDKDLVTGYSMEDTLNLAAKVDILGLRAATLVQDVCQLVGIKPEDIDVEDPVIYRNLQNLTCPHGLFQIEADCNYKVLQKIKPRNLNDLSAIVAIARPGALQFTESYAQYVESGEYQSVHPFFDDVFKPSGGLCLYQEDLMRAANKIGFTLDESEILRRIVGKKKLDEVKEWQSKIENKVKENKLSPELSGILWKILDDSASYSFNKSHSASYATMCAATAYLKFKYPKEFFVTLLRLSQDEPNPIEEVSKIYKELPYFNIQLLPPSITKSANNYEIEGDNIRMGLNSVKSISDKALTKLDNFKNKYSSKFDIFRAANSAGLNLGIVSNLIWAGSLDDMLTESRATTQMEFVLWNLLTGKGEKEWASKLEKEYNSNLIEIVKALNEKVKNEKGKPIIKDSRRLTIRKGFAPYMEMYKANQNNPDIFTYVAERFLLGFAYSKTLYDIYKPHVDNLVTIQEILGDLEDTKVKFVADVAEISLGKTKKGSECMKLQVKDHTGDIRIMVFENSYNDGITRSKEASGRMIVENDIIICEGIKKDGACVFGELVTAQNANVFLKISQMPKEKINE